MSFRQNGTLPIESGIRAACAGKRCEFFFLGQGLCGDLWWSGLFNFRVAICPGIPGYLVSFTIPSDLIRELLRLVRPCIAYQPGAFHIE